MRFVLLYSFFISFFIFSPMTISAQTPETTIAHLMAPHTHGKLRASINLGNPILANKDPVTGEPIGVSVDLARALAKKLNLELELVVFDSAGKSVQAVQDDQADVGFFAIDPKRGEGIHFTKAYVLIEGSYLVREGSALKSNDEVDRAHTRVAVGKGSAYDLFLTRELKNATIVRAPTSPTVVDMFVEENLEVAAGVKQAVSGGAPSGGWHLRRSLGRWLAPAAARAASRPRLRRVG